MDRVHKNTRSTSVPKQDTPPEDYIEHFFLPQESHKTQEIFIALFATDTHGVVYTNLMGKFPHQSSSGMKYILILYHYDSNAILLKTLRNRSDIETLKAYKDLYYYPDARGLSPCLNTLDNEASTSVKQLIIKS